MAVGQVHPAFAALSTRYTTRIWLARGFLRRRVELRHWLDHGLFEMPFVRQESKVIDGNGFHVNADLEGYFDETTGSSGDMPSFGNAVPGTIK